jgi:RNA polymerase sigma factor (sigma-70 family)
MPPATAQQTNIMTLETFLPWAHARRPHQRPDRVLGKRFRLTVRYVGVNADRLELADFADFYEASKDAIYRSVVLATRQPDRAEDAVSDAFAKAYQNWPQLREHPSPMAWVVRTALNSFRSSWRIWSREVSEAPDVVAIAPPARSLDPDLAKAIWHLPRRQRQVIALRVLADLDTNHTAAALGIAPKTVTVHLHRALAALRSALETSEWERYA